MIYFVVFAAGLLQTAMASFNGILSESVGLYGTSLVVHVIGGALLALYIALVQKKRIRLGPMPWYLYSAGVFGLILVAFTSLCVTKIGVAFSTCLSIAGQLFISIVIDHYGLLGVKKVRFNRRRVPCLALIVAGLLLINFAR